MNKELAAAPVKMVLSRNTVPTTIHSDMGSQYTSELFENTLLAAGIKHAYSHKGCPGDNARIESFHSILKREYVNCQSFKNIYEATAGLEQYIRWYNTDRISLVA